MRRWLRPHRIPLLLALAAAVAETAADVLQPWPIKLVVDNVILGRKLAGGFDRIIFAISGGGAVATLNLAVAAVVVIAVSGGRRVVLGEAPHHQP